MNESSLNLAEVIEAQIGCAEGLIAILDEEHAALSGRSIEALEAACASKADAASKLQRLGDRLQILAGPRRSGAEFEAWLMRHPGGESLANALLDVTPEPREIEARPSKRQKVFRLGMVEMLRGALGREAVQVAQINNQLEALEATAPGGRRRGGDHAQRGAGSRAGAPATRPRRRRNSMIAAASRWAMPWPVSRTSMRTLCQRLFSK